jgi:hypothetical protein
MCSTKRFNDVQHTLPPEFTVGDAEMTMNLSGNFSLPSDNNFIGG